MCLSDTSKDDGSKLTKSVDIGKMSMAVKGESQEVNHYKTGEEDSYSPTILEHDNCKGIIKETASSKHKENGQENELIGCEMLSFGEDRIVCDESLDNVGENTNNKSQNFESKNFPQEIPVVYTTTRF